MNGEMIKMHFNYRMGSLVHFKTNEPHVSVSSSRAPVAAPVCGRHLGRPNTVGRDTMRAVLDAENGELHC